MPAETPYITQWRRPAFESADESAQKSTECPRVPPGQTSAGACAACLRSNNRRLKEALQSQWLLRHAIPIQRLLSLRSAAGLLRDCSKSRPPPPAPAYR